MISLIVVVHCLKLQAPLPMNANGRVYELCLAGLFCFHRCETVGGADSIDQHCSGHCLYTMLYFRHLYILYMKFPSVNIQSFSIVRHLKVRPTQFAHQKEQPFFLSTGTSRIKQQLTQNLHRKTTFNQSICKNLVVPVRRLSVVIREPNCQDTKERYCGFLHSLPSVCFAFFRYCSKKWPDRSEPTNCCKC